MTVEPALKKGERECVCGGIIHLQPLPPDIAAAAGRPDFWVHDTGDIYCYEGDVLACAEPLS